MDNSILMKALVSSKESYQSFVAEDMESILNIIRTHLGMDVAFIAEFADGRRYFRCVDSSEKDPAVKVGGYDPLEETYCQRIVDGRLPELIPDTAANPITSGLKVTEALAIGSYIGVPIYVSGDTLFGTFCCYSHQADPTLVDRDLSLLKVFADFASMQIDRQLDNNRQHLEMSQRLSGVFENADSLQIVYQPIYDLTQNRVAGYESLSRFSIQPYRSPDVWFNEAAQVGLGERLELMAIERALSAFDRLPRGSYLSFNSSPETILNGGLLPLIKSAADKNLIIELTEHSRISDYPIFRRALDALREYGVRFAIDDAGAGYASFYHLLELGAEVIKLDISLIRDIHLDPARCALAAALIAFAKETKSEIIAEGVECEGELAELRRLGVGKVQGYFIAKPMPWSELRQWSWPPAKIAV